MAADVLELLALGGFALLSALLGVDNVATTVGRFRVRSRIRERVPIDVQDVHTAPPPHEFEGRARRHEETVTAPFTGTECLAYEYEVQERRDRYDVTVDEGGVSVPFLLEDATGTALVDPDGADLRLTVDLGREFDPRTDGDSLPAVPENDAGASAPELPDGEVAWIVERRLDAGDDVYVFGEGAPDGSWGGHTASVDDGEATPLFLVSDEHQDALANRFLVTGVARLLVGLAFLAVGGYAGLLVALAVLW